MELFSSSEMAWIGPVLTVCALIILLAAWALRREIAAFFRNFFFPKQQRYTLARPIIANKPGQSQRASINKQIIPQPVGDYVPSQFTIIDKAQFTSNLQGSKAPRSSLKSISIMWRWYWRKLKRSIGGGKAKEAAKPAPEPKQKQEPVRTMREAILNPPPPEPSKKKEGWDGRERRRAPRRSERIIFIFVMVILAVFIIFLGAHVSKLSTAVQKQNAFIQDMQNRQRVIVYEMPPAVRTIPDRPARK